MAVGTSGGGGKSKGIRAGAAYVEGKFVDTGLRAGLARARSMVVGFGKSVSLAGGALLGLGSIPLGATLFKSVNILKDLGKQGEMAKSIGITAERFTGLAGAFERFGMDGQAVLDILTDVSDWTLDAARHGGALEETFQELGLNAKELVKLPVDKQFNAIADAMARLPETEAAGLAARLGGDFQKLLPLLRKGSSAIDAIADSFATSTEAVEEASKANAAYMSVTASISRVWRQIAVSVAPAITGVSEALYPAIRLTGDWVGANRHVILGVLGASAAVSGLGLTLLGLGGTIKLAVAALGGLGMVAGFIFSPIGVAAIAATAAIVGAGVALAKFGGGAGGIMDNLSGIGGVLKETFDGARDALFAGDWELGFQIVLQGLGTSWKLFILGIENSLKKMWEGAKLNAKSFSADAALALGKSQKDSSWTDGIVALWNEFDHDVLGGKNQTDMPDALVKRNGKTFLSENDAKLAAAVLDHTRAIEALNKSYTDAVDAINREGQAEAQRLKEQFAALRREAAIKANTKIFGDFMRDLGGPVDFGKDAANARVGIQGAMSMSGFGNIDRSTFGVGGGKSVEDKQLDELKGINKGLKNMKVAAWG